MDINPKLRWRMPSAWVPRARGRERMTMRISISRSYLENRFLAQPNQFISVSILALLQRFNFGLVSLGTDHVVQLQAVLWDIHDCETQEVQQSNGRIG
jgi:hypothetical protein